MQIFYPQRRITPHSFSVGCTKRPGSRECGKERRKEMNVTVPDEPSLGQVMKAVNNDKSFDNICLQHNIIKIALYLCGLLSENLNPHLIMRKISN